MHGAWFFTYVYIFLFQCIYGIWKDIDSLHWYYDVHKSLRMVFGTKRRRRRSIEKRIMPSHWSIAFDLHLENMLHHRRHHIVLTISEWSCPSSTFSPASQTHILTHSIAGIENEHRWIPQRTTHIPAMGLHSEQMRRDAKLDVYNERDAPRTW